MSDSTQGTGAADDDTLVRPVRNFYPDQTPPSAGDDRPTLAERIMNRMPPPPEKAEVRAEYEAKQAEREAELERARERLQREDEERAQRKQAAHDRAAREKAARDQAREKAAQDRADQTQHRRGHVPAVAGAAAAGAAVGAAGSAVAARSASTPAASPATAPLLPHAERPAHTDPTPTGAAARTESDPEPLVRRTRRTRRARLRIARIDPWSVMKTFFLFSIAGGIMFFTAIVVIYSVVESSGLFDQVDTMVTDLLGQPQDDTPFQVREILGWERVMGVTALLACVNVVILTALATLGSFLYNLASTMLGGLEVTLAED